jgi:hypothetical protein
MTPGPQESPQPQPRMAAAMPRPTSLPALLYVLAAFGVIAGAFGARNALAVGVDLLKPREVYAQQIAARNALFKPLVPAADLERYGQREAETRYARRNAALPLAAVGLIVSALLFTGCMRAMRGDPWGLSAWELAAWAGLAYQLVSTALAMVTARDLTRTFEQAPSTAMPLLAGIQMEALFALLLGGLAVVYFGACVLYLRTPGVRHHFSVDGTGTPPSA